METKGIREDRLAAGNDALSKVIESLNRTLDLNEVLLKCLEAVKIALNSEASSLMLLDKDRQMLKVSMATGPVKDEIKGATIPKNKGIAGWVLNNNEPYISNDVDHNEIFWKELSPAFKTRNIICVPLWDANGKVFGILEAINKVDNLSFDESDLYTFDSLALQVSSAIERSKVYEAQVQQLGQKKEYISELHHRLKNSLSVISGLIEFDIDDVKDEKARYLLTFTNSRIRTLAKAHSAQSEGKGEDHIELDEYIRDIIKNAENTFNDFDKRIAVNSNLIPTILDLNRSILCGLSVNELLLHELSRLMEDETVTEVNVKLEESESAEVKITIETTGSEDEEVAGLKNGNPNSRFIVKSLINKLDGKIEHSSTGAGSKTMISFLR
ncbi:GAF domain-containing protein [Gracilimonas sp. Q87]|uniref:GAF domain-containing protein n=1 Tax=Gracilimonas sp. Q87 TaxID=3384766 RepID=UPI0039846000